MLSKIRQTKKDQGFTIIEVLIVLAIAGLIMLVVFLAVPALQRNSRNTQRITDAGNVLTGISEFVGNNNGQLPAAGATSGTGATLTIGTASNNTIPVRLGYYTANNISIVDYSAANAVNPDNNDQLRVIRGAVCDPAVIGNATNTGASTRGVVILYTLESSSKQCRAS